MKTEVAKNINRDFDNFAWESLEAYAHERISHLYGFLECARDDDILLHQGAIKELRNLLRLKENTKNVLEQARK